MAEKSCAVCVGVIVSVVVGIFVILIAVSFSGVEFYEYGFPRRKSTGTVSTDSVYSGGKYMIGPDKEFKTFPADAHIEDVYVSIFTEDKLEVDIVCSFQYFLRPDDLKLLHDTHDIYYAPVLRTSAIDALKGEAPNFSTDEYISNRDAIELALTEAIALRLGGKCCKKNCADSVEGCVRNCRPFNDCTDEDLGYSADLKYFQLRKVTIAQEVISNNLLALTQLEDAIQEQFIQEAQVVRKETERQVAAIQNEAAEITQNATAEANLIVAKAEAEARAVVEEAHNQGLKDLYSKLGFGNDDGYKASFNYLRTLRDKEDVHLNVDFDSLRINV
ncbi:uncharacterized protein LOC144450899 [Glandiceps talaboti]